MAQSEIKQALDKNGVRDSLGLTRSYTYPAVANGTDNGSTAITLDYNRTQKRINIYVGNTNVGYLTVNGGGNFRNTLVSRLADRWAA